MIILFIAGLLLGGVAVVFALQNSDIITVAFFRWELTASLSVIILLAILMGVLTVLLILLPGSVGNYFKNRKLQKLNSKLEDELRKQKELTVFARNSTPSEAEISKIENGVSENHSS